MEKKIRSIQKEADDALAKAETVADVEKIKVKFLGRKGAIQALMPQLKDASPEERPLVGRQINDLKQHVTAECDTTFERLQLEEESCALPAMGVTTAQITAIDPHGPRDLKMLYR